ncbi:MAG: hypothetical protein AABX52_00740 [Nanoarchaeota archaeon]
MSQEQEPKPWYKHFYETNLNYLLFIPMLMLLLAIFQISYQVATTGDFVQRGVSLKGGSTITIPNKVVNIEALQSYLTSQLPNVEVRSINNEKGVIIEAADVQVTTLLKTVESQTGTLDPRDYAAREIGSSLGSSFFIQLIWAMLLSFVLMALVVLLTFRTLAPSAAVILAAFSDIIVTLAIFNILGMKLSSAGIAGFLMLIGYSVDTDILLTTNVIRKRHPPLWDRIYMSITTGMTMLTCTLSAVIVSLLLFHSETIQQIMLIILIGLLVDMIMTWIQNVALLKWYADKKGIV